MSGTRYTWGIHPQSQGVEKLIVEDGKEKEVEVEAEEDPRMKMSLIVWADFITTALPRKSCWPRNRIKWLILSSFLQSGVGSSAFSDFAGG